EAPAEPAAKKEAPAEPAAKEEAPAEPAAKKEAPAEPAVKDSAAPSDDNAPLFSRPDGDPDDLKRISGVGPVLETKLHDLGITKFEQVANFTADDIARVDDRLAFKGRIERDGWLDQAKTFAAEAK
ncbi:MAG: proton-conducting membrane transporter, partial [Rhizobiaceae bacterium]|nr:proton-conducting membrane transporter [Rhizobiaceae bacterium]